MHVFVKRFKSEQKTTTEVLNFILMTTEFETSTTQATTRQRKIKSSKSSATLMTFYLISLCWIL